MDRKKLGKNGEQLAESYLIEKGYQMLEKNYLKRVGEIDLIAFEPLKKEIVFVEVKTRRNNNFGYPEEAVNGKKVQKIEKAALAWLMENKKLDQLWRIDIVSVEIVKTIKITHLENVTL